MSESRGRILNRVELADFAGKSLPTIDAWVRSGCPFIDRGGRGREWSFNSADVLDWRERRAAAAVEEKAAPGDLDPNQERARKDRALAIQTEMKNAVAQGEVVVIDEVIRQVTTMLGVIKAKFLALPSRAQTRFNPAKPTELHQILEAEVHEILTELSDPENLEAVRDAEQKRDAADRRAVEKGDRGRDRGVPARQRNTEPSASRRAGQSRKPKGE